MHAVPLVFRMISKNITRKRLLLAFAREYRLSKLYRVWKDADTSGGYIRKLYDYELECFTEGITDDRIPEKFQKVLIRNRDKSNRLNSVCKVCWNLLHIDDPYHTEYCQHIQYVRKIKASISFQIRTLRSGVCDICRPTFDFYRRNILYDRDVSDHVSPVLTQLYLNIGWKHSRKCSCLQGLFQLVN